MEEDYYGLYVLCLNCGYVTYPDVATVVERPVEEEQRTVPRWAAQYL